MNWFHLFDADKLFVETIVEVGQVVGVESHQVQDRRVQVPHVQFTFDRGRAEFVGLSIAHTSFDAATGHIHRKAVGIVVATRLSLELGCRLSSEFAAPDDERFVEHSTLFEILNQRSDRLIGTPTVVAVIGVDIFVGIPVVVIVCTSRIELHKPYAPLNQSTGEQALATKILRLRMIEAVERVGVGCLLRQVHGLWRMLLHLVGKFVAIDPRSEVTIFNATALMLLIVCFELIEQPSLHCPRSACRQD